MPTQEQLEVFPGMMILIMASLTVASTFSIPGYISNCFAVIGTDGGVGREGGTTDLNCYYYYYDLLSIALL